MMRILVIGAGAMGGTFAGYLAHSGNDVHVVDKSERIIEAIRTNGLRLKTPEGKSIAAEVTCYSEISEVGPCDLGFVFVKANATEAVAEEMSRFPSMPLVTLQNGWGNAETLSSAVGADQLLVGVTYNSATSLGPGTVNHTREGDTVVGAFETSSQTDTARAVAAVLNDSGLPTTVDPDVAATIWSKLIVNAAVLPVSALTRLRGSLIAANENASHVSEVLATEAVRVGRAMGFDIDRDERVSVIMNMMSSAGMGKNSMLSDVEAERPTEINVITGAVVREGKRNDVETPVSEEIWNLVQALETSWI